MKESKSSREKIPTLLDYLTKEGGWEYISELRYAREEELAQILEVLEHTPPEAFSLKDWNEALVYLAEAPACNGEADAREALMACLNREKDGILPC